MPGVDGELSDGETTFGLAADPNIIVSSHYRYC
jgi:hypothetical protein